MTRPVAAIDFDGVVHQYYGWDGETPTGPPVLGVRTGLQRLKDAGFSLTLFTARSGHDEIRKWLDRHTLGHFFSEITSTKPKGAVVFFDDRAINVPANVPDALDRKAKAFMLSYVIDAS